MENSNPDMHILVLARPADAVCTILDSALCQWRYVFTMHFTVYKAVSAIENIPADRTPVLIVRPAMLDPLAVIFIKRHFPNLRIIGWVDSGEKVSDCAIVRTAANGVVMVSGLDQLQQVIQSFRKTVSQNQFSADGIQAVFPGGSERLEYELSDDEVTALLGVE